MGLFGILMLLGEDYLTYKSLKNLMKSMNT